VDKAQELELKAEYRRSQRSAASNARITERTSRPGVGTYVGRLTESGYRMIATTDGGVTFNRYFGNAAPPTQPELFVRGGLGQPGITNSRPAT
jgi:hypothetical protein